MFGFGPWEIAVIVGVILMFAGPTVLPRLGRYLGRNLKGLQEGAQSFQENLRDEMEQKEDGQEQLSPGAAEKDADAAAKPSNEARVG